MIISLAQANVKPKRGVDEFQLDPTVKVTQEDFIH